MKSFKQFCLGVLVLLFSEASSLLADEPPASSPKISLKMTCRAKGQEFELCKKAIEDWKKHWKETKGQDCDVEVISLPPNSSDARTFTLQLLMGQSGDIDICQVDILWPVFLAPYVAPLDEAFPQEVQETYFPIAIQSNTIDGKLVAIPWYVDVDVLFYRKDVLSLYGYPHVPQNWQHLIAQAKGLPPGRERYFDDKVLGYVFRGKSYEGLMCHVVEWVEAFEGHLFTPGTPPQESAIVQAMQFCASLVPDVSPMGVLNYTQEEVRGVFQSGGAIFAHNWPYMWNLVQAEGSPVKGKVGMTVISPSVLGGWGICISKHSQYKEAAINLIQWLVRPEEQKRRALEGGYFPSIVTLYTDTAVLAKNLHFPMIKKAIDTAVIRPVAAFGRFYPQMSAAVTNIVQKVISHEVDPAQGAKQLIEVVASFQKKAQEAGVAASTP